MTGLCRELHVRMGPGWCEVPRWNAYLPVGCNAIRLGGMWSSSSRRNISILAEKTWRQSSCTMGRRGSRWSLSRMPSRRSLWRECAYHHAKYGNWLQVKTMSRGFSPITRTSDLIWYKLLHLLRVTFNRKILLSLYWV